MDFIVNSQLRKYLKESDDPYRLLFTKGNYGLLMNLHDTDGTPQRYIDTNSKALEMLGYERSELLTMSPQDLIVEERCYEENEIETFDRQTCDRYVMEACLKKKDGNLIDVEMSDHCFDFKGSGITLSIVRDISRRKVYERKIENANDQWRNTFDSISDFVSV
ncbi:MAG: PAS domain S-box protein, partial [Bacteroidetes bacterium]|nr:PAS domain S-box protein [Bacteroidota bacterium]